jgi:hypothetical protein
MAHSSKCAKCRGDLPSGTVIQICTLATLLAVHWLNCIGGDTQTHIQKRPLARTNTHAHTNAAYTFTRTNAHTQTNSHTRTHKDTHKNKFTAGYMQCPGSACVGRGWYGAVCGVPSYRYLVHYAFLCNAHALVGSRGDVLRFEMVVASKEGKGRG